MLGRPGVRRERLPGPRTGQEEWQPRDHTVHEQVLPPPVRKLCNQRNNLSWDCGEDGINGGSSRSVSTYHSNGRSWGQAVGSERGSQDWVCSGRYDGFDNPR